MDSLLLSISQSLNHSITQSLIVLIGPVTQSAVLGQAVSADARPGEDHVAIEFQVPSFTSQVSGLSDIWFLLFRRT